MRNLKIPYLLMTVTVVCFFVAMFFFSLKQEVNAWYCLIPVWIACFDYVRANRKSRRSAFLSPAIDSISYEEFLRTHPNFVTNDRITPLNYWEERQKVEEVNLFTDFLKEEEFKV